ncbi:hypothetical protein EJB05_53621, partial [Eragrostis curvula]
MTIQIQGSRMTATIGFAVLSLAVISAGVSLSACGLLLSLVGVLAGVNVIAHGVRWRTDDPTTLIIGAAVLAGVVGAFPLRNLAVVGIILASSAVTAAAAGPALWLWCLSMFALLLLGLGLINRRILYIILQFNTKLNGRRRMKVRTHVWN